MTAEGKRLAIRIWSTVGATDMRKGFEGNGAKIRNFWDVCGGRVCGLPVPIRGGLAD
jgi:hypothetical protein